MRRFWVLVAIAAAVAGCGGGSSSSPDNSAGAAPKELTIDQQNFTEVTVAWDEVSGAEIYHLYYSSDPDFDSDHFATYPHGTWVQDVTSPHSVEMPESGPNYYFVVTAVDGDGNESFPFLPESSKPNLRFMMTQARRWTGMATFGSAARKARPGSPLRPHATGRLRCLVPNS